MSVTIINGDLLNATEDYILHQCNCVSIDAKALAEKIFAKYPYANTYRFRSGKGGSLPGTFDILGNGTSQRYIINLYSQYYPGAPKYANDSAEIRLQWFIQGLSGIACEGVKSIAIPYNIGCGAARGDWTVYSQIIEKFAIDNNIKVTIYKL